MDTPPGIEPPFEEETILERVYALSEMFPEPLRNLVSFTPFKWAWSKARVVSWFIASTAAILVLPISLEVERQQYEQQMKRQERDILLGGAASPAI